MIATEARPAKIDVRMVISCAGRRKNPVQKICLARSLSGWGADNVVVAAIEPWREADSPAGNIQTDCRGRPATHRASPFSEPRIPDILAKAHAGMRASQHAASAREPSRLVHGMGKPRLAAWTNAGSNQ